MNEAFMRDFFGMKPAASNKAACERCRYSRKTNLYDTFKCRVQAPIFKPQEPHNHHHLRQWPTVSGADWCGEFAEKRAA